jgi:dTDP-4-amino-4,6-dideoxygalactose transaminase
MSRFTAEDDQPRPPGPAARQLRSAPAMPERNRIFLSPPHMGPDERELLLEAFDSNWIAPLGPHVDAFERELAAAVGIPHAAALSSGTAGLHLALHLLGVGPGDDVLVSTFTFVATAYAVVYVGARPVFIDSEPSTWTIDVGLLVEEIEARAKRGRLPKAVVVVDLYGQCADYDPLLEVCGRYDIPVIEDAAEALGATYRGRQAGTFGTIGVFSFNGNKVITTSGGGMLVTHDAALADRARFLSTQARDPGPGHVHSEIGFNYRLSNLLAAVGRGQLRHLEEWIGRRRYNNAFYREALGDLGGIDFMPNAPYGEPICWFTCITVDPDAFGATSDQVMLSLEELNIETRPPWKPLHTQPVFKGCEYRGGEVAERFSSQGVCLPSGSNLSEENLERVVEGVRSNAR